MSTLVALAFSLLVGPAPALQPLPTTLPPHLAVPAPPAPPRIDVTAYVVHDVAADADIASFDPQRRRAMASVTKVMTALLVAENAEFDDRVTISVAADATPIGYIGQPEVLAGEVWTIEELLDFLLVQSGNDAAVALAEHVSGSTAAFVDAMNERAAQLGLDDTSYRNPNGLDQDGHFQSADDLISLGHVVIDSEAIMRTVRLKALTFTPSGRSVAIANTNRLIGSFPGMHGIKTGDTRNAAQVLLSLTDTGVHRYLSVVMGSPSHTAATAELMTWALGANGPRAHLLAPLSGSVDEVLVPLFEQPWLAAAGTLADGLATAGNPTPAELAVVERLVELLPAVLGGRG